MKSRIVFMGTPEFALPTLEALVESYSVVGVVTQPDRPAGRGRKLVPSPVKEMAESEGIPVFQPERVRRLEAVEYLRSLAPDVMVVAAFGQILPASVLEIAPFGVLNVHASLLPRWRGAAPIEGAILAGDSVTGVTIMKMNEGLDTGPVLSMCEIPIGEEETAGELRVRLAAMGAELMMDVLPEYLGGRLQPQPQPEDGVTITRRIKKSAAKIDWNKSAVELHRHIRAFSPEPGAYTQCCGNRFKILRAQMIDTGDMPLGRPGTVFEWEKMPVVVTGDGCLALLQVQMAGKRPMEGGIFMRGKRDFVGTCMGSQTPGRIRLIARFAYLKSH